MILLITASVFSRFVTIACYNDIYEDTTLAKNLDKLSREKEILDYFKSRTADKTEAVQHVSESANDK